MAHGSFKPTRKHLNDAMRGKHGGPHEAHMGKHVKRIKVLQTMERESRREMGQIAYER